MIPILDPVGKADIANNKAHKKCRCEVERSIGVLKCRFRCLCKQSGRAIQFDVNIACSIIGACAVLHNYCRFRNIPFEVAADIEADITRKDTSCVLFVVAIKLKNAKLLLHSTIIVGTQFKSKRVKC